MAQQFLNPASTAPNDKLGDTPNSASDKINANTTELYGKTAANASAIIATNTSISGFTKTYWFNSSDTATTATPIAHTGGSATTFLTSNGLGLFTDSYNPESNADIWNTSTNKFDFTSLKIGDTIEFRGDIEFTNLAAQEVDLIMSLGEGTATPFELTISHNYYKTAGTGTHIVFLFRVYIGDPATRDGGARFRFSSVVNATIQVNGWFSQITEV